MSNYKSEVELLKQAKSDAQQATVFHEFIQENPGLDYEAAKQILRKGFEDCGELWTKSTLKEYADICVRKGTLSVKAPPTHEDILSAEQEERESLTAWILANRGYQPESIAPERARFMNPRATNILTLREIK